MRPRVMFVDDEPAVLDAMRDRLRRYRDAWELVFFDSPLAALDDLSTHRADVVVSDVRMPKMSGAELLGRARVVCPAATRIALTGQTDAETAMQLHLAAHQFLSKPCDVHRIIELVERRARLSAMVPEGAISIATSAPEVPASPATYRELETLFARESWTLADAAKVIERDEIASSQLLRIASSPYFGARPVRTVLEGLSLLGAKTVQRIILGLNAQGAFANVPRAHVAQHTRHALTIAERASSFAAPARRSEAFVAGLLHDIGGLVLAVVQPDVQRQLSAQHGADERELVARERAAYGFDHADVGAALLAIWGLPCDLVEAVLLHHREGGSPLASWLRDADDPTVATPTDRGATP